MAVFTFDTKNNRISILVESMDSIREREAGQTTILASSHFMPGYLFASGNVEVVMMRGERD